MSSHPPTPDLAQNDTRTSRSRRLRYVLAALALAVVMLYLAGPLLSSTIVPPPPSPETCEVALVIKDGQPWLALPRPDGSVVAFAFAPQTQPASPLDTAASLFSSQPGMLLKDELATTRSLTSAALDMHAQETWIITAPMQKTFQLAAALDALWAQNIATLSNSSGHNRVLVPSRYVPLGFNANHWTAVQLRELGAQVRGMGILTRWSVDPTAP